MSIYFYFIISIRKRKQKNTEFSMPGALCLTIVQKLIIIQKTCTFPLESEGYHGL